jgi:hypothetical protein
MGWHTSKSRGACRHGPASSVRVGKTMRLEKQGQVTAESPVHSMSAGVSSDEGVMPWGGCPMYGLWPGPKHECSETRAGRSDDSLE